MSKGIVRKIDELGRVVIPIEIRRTTGIDISAHTDLFIENGIIRLSKGYGRGIDELGRYCIPKEIRRRHGWGIGQEMEIFEDSGNICIKKVGCEWCDNTEDLHEVKGHCICKDCALAVTDMVMEQGL